MDCGQPLPKTFSVRPARREDVIALMRLKRALAESENAGHAVRASVADWLRDGFGPDAGFTAFVAEGGTGDRDIIGMATCSQRKVTGWDGPVIFLQDLFVEPEYRHQGVARALIGEVAAYAESVGSIIVELTVHAKNPAQAFYLRYGFQHLPECLTFVLAGPALAALARPDDCKPGDGKPDKNDLALAG